jgi:guanylate kinase
MKPRPGHLIVICGPAGSGKTTLCDALCARHPGLRRLVTSTTRAPRPGERDGVDYHFLSVAEFETLLAAGAFLEHARVHGRYYGSQRRHVVDTLQSGHDLLLNIDIQGARTFRTHAAEVPELAGRLVTVFIRPRDFTQIRERLQGRGESEAEIARRLASASIEMQAADEFDHQIVSGSRDEDIAALEALYLSLRPAI